MWDPAPGGVVGGSVTMRLTPAKVLAPTLGPWQAAQLPLMPPWLNSELVKRAPSTTGVAAMLLPAPTWHCSQGALVGRWLAGGATIEKPAAGIANWAAAAALWHCAQLALVLGALAWIAVSVGLTL
jgi:hypothetical protein